MSDFTVLCVNTFAAYIGVIPFMIILQIIFKKHKLPKRHQFGLYLYALAICSILMSTDTPSLYQLNFDPQFNFIPFYGVMDNLNHYMQSFFLFMPLGLLLPTLWKQFQPPKKVFLYMLLFSFLIEISQVFCFANTAVTDITDIIMNLLGSAVDHVLLHSLPCHGFHIGRIHLPKLLLIAHASVRPSEIAVCLPFIRISN